MVYICPLFPKDIVLGPPTPHPPPLAPKVGQNVRQFLLAFSQAKFPPLPTDQFPTTPNQGGGWLYAPLDLQPRPGGGRYFGMVGGRGGGQLRATPPCGMVARKKKERKEEKKKKRRWKRKKQRSPRTRRKILRQPRFSSSEVGTLFLRYLYYLHFLVIFPPK